MNQPSENPDRHQFPDARLCNTDALHNLMQATSLSESYLLQQIPELKMDHLAFGLHWPSDYYDDSEIGRFNADAVRDFVVIHVPVLNVAGDVQNNLSQVNASYHIYLQTSKIQGFNGFYDAEEDLGEKYATARIVESNA